MFQNNDYQKKTARCAVFFNYERLIFLYIDQKTTKSCKGIPIKNISQRVGGGATKHSSNVKYIASIAVQISKETVSAVSTGLLQTAFNTSRTIDVTGSA